VRAEYASAPLVSGALHPRCKVLQSDWCTSCTICELARPGHLCAWSSSAETAQLMRGAPRNRTLLRIAWVLPAVFLLCAFQFGWLDSLGSNGGSGGGAATGSASPLLVSFGRRDLSGGGSGAAGSETYGNAGVPGAQGPTRRCGPEFDVPKVCLFEQKRVGAEAASTTPAFADLEHTKESALWQR